MSLALTNCEEALLRFARWTGVDQLSMAGCVGQALASQEHLDNKINWNRVLREIRRNYSPQQADWIMAYGRKMAHHIQLLEEETSRPEGLE